jgi:hypothetical protein
MATRTGRGERPPRPADADGFRESWAGVERGWQETLMRAADLEPDLLHERVDGEWSFVETLRHLLFVTDAWAARALLGRDAPYHPLGLPPTGMRNAAIPNDPGARPPLAEVLGLREERVALVGGVLAGLSDDDLAGRSIRVRGPGYPRAGTYPVRRCVQTLVGEEWQHRRYAERDLATLADRGGRGVPDTGDGPGA